MNRNFDAVQHAINVGRELIDTFAGAGRWWCGPSLGASMTSAFRLPAAPAGMTAAADTADAAAG